MRTNITHGLIRAPDGVHLLQISFGSKRGMWGCGKGSLNNEMGQSLQPPALSPDTVLLFGRAR